LACARAQANRDSKESAFLDSLNGALISAGAAADTNVGVDDVLAITLGNSLNGALVGAGAASDTSVSDIVSHDITSMFDVYDNIP